MLLNEITHHLGLIQVHNILLFSDCRCKSPLDFQLNHGKIYWVESIPNCQMFFGKFSNRLHYSEYYLDISIVFQKQRYESQNRDQL
jgi:hypothetical protein